MRRSGRGATRRITMLSLVVAFAATTIMSFLAPFLSGEASATSDDPTRYVNLIQRGWQGQDKEGSNPNQITDKSAPYGTCQPYFERVTKTRDFLKQHFYSDIEKLPYDDDINKLKDLYNPDRMNNTGAHVPSKIGTITTQAHMVYIMQYMGRQEISIIKFRAAPDNANPLDGNYSGNGGICGSFVMLPIDNNTWRGYEFDDLDNRSGSVLNHSRYMEFNMESMSTSNNSTVGNFDYWTKLNGDGYVGQVKTALVNQQRGTNKKLVVEGTPQSPTQGGAGGSSGMLSASWIDAATIKVNGGNGKFSSEVYKKHSWGSHKVGNTYYNYYFLDTATAGRENLTWANNTKRCETALPLSSACGGSGVCVPFIAVKQNLTLVPSSDDDLKRLQKDIDQLGGADAELFDFKADTCLQDGGLYNVALLQAQDAKIWFYFSETSKALRPVFPTGGENETPFIGLYAEATPPKAGPSGNEGKYVLGKCTAEARGMPPSAGDSFRITWRLTNPTNCETNPELYGQLNVWAKGGAAGEAGFAAVQEQAQNTNDTGAGEAKFICNLTPNPFSWIFCPLTRLALEGIDTLEAIINDTLTLDTDRIFNDKFYQVWENFRTLALALLVIAALIMVISQAAGAEFLDAYTIKKMLPRILFAAIAITVSWAVMNFLVTLSNDAGMGVRYIIYSPFPDTTDLGGVAFTGFLVALLSGGALLALGLLGMLSFILTALLAAAVGFGMIVFRELLLMFLVMSAPFALAAYTIPEGTKLPLFVSTEKLFDLWKNAFFACLVVFIIISAFIALGRVFAIVAIESGGSETLNQIIAIIAYILPYFLITTAFRLAGGILSTVGGFMNDRTKGGFDRLRNFRSNQREQRGKRWREGRLYDSDNMLMRPDRRGPLGAIAKLANNVGERRGLGWRRGRFGFGEHGRQASALHTLMEAEHERKNNGWLEALANSDDKGMFVLAASGGNAARARQIADQRVANGVWNANEAEEAVKAAMAVGINRGTAVAALQKMAENKSREIAPGDVFTIRRAIADVSEGNSVLADKLNYDFQFRSRTSGGRVDLGGVSHTAGALAEANQLAASMTRMGGATNVSGQALTSAQQVQENALGVVAQLDGIDRVGVQAAMAGHPNEVKQLGHTVKTALKYGDEKQKEKAALAAYEMHKGLAAGAVGASNRDELNKFLSELGIDSYTLNQAGVSVEDALAAKVGRDPLEARDINGTIIRDAAGNPVHNPYTGATLSARARAFDTQSQRAGMMNDAA